MKVIQESKIIDKGHIITHTFSKYLSSSIYVPFCTVDKMYNKQLYGMSCARRGDKEFWKYLTENQHLKRYKGSKL